MSFAAIADETLGEVQPAADPRRHAGGREGLAILDPSGPHRLRPEQLEDVDVRPVRGGGSSIDETGGREDERAGADGHHDISAYSGGGGVVNQGLCLQARSVGSLAPGTMMANGAWSSSNV
jgi:hypothetical protein